MKKNLSLVSVLSLLTIAEVQAAQCYRFITEETPENLPILTDTDRAEASQEHTWCYEFSRKNGKNFVYAYSAADGKVDPALSALTEFDKKGEIVSVAHGSFFRGDTNFSRSTLKGFNPLSRPLDPISAAMKGEAVAVTLDAEAEASRSETLSQLEAQFEAPQALSKIQVGTMEKTVPSERYPYSAYWWPHAGLPLVGILTKYDTIVKKWTGTDPKSREWEATNHSLQHVPWGGHCNGWAASSVLYKEVSGVRTEPQTGVSLTTSDFNGILAEASFCVDWAFFGKRNNGAPGDDPRDIPADRFHEVMLYYIGTLGKPVAMDYEPDASVDNNVATGFKFVVTKNSTAPNTYDVAATLQMHHYNYGIDEIANDVAPMYSRSYNYQLTTDASGNIIGGTWTGYDNPDFLWVPLAQKNCGRENPRIDPAQVQKMMNLTATSSSQISSLTQSSGSR